MTPTIPIKEYFAKAKSRKAKRAAKALTLFPRQRKKYKRHSEWRRLRDTCDALMSFLVRMRDKRPFNGLCRICGKRPATVAYHLIPRSRYATRWLELNVVAACTPCNYAENMNRLAYREKHRQIFGAEVYDRLEQEARRLVKYSVEDLRKLADSLRERIALL